MLPAPSSRMAAFSAGVMRAEMTMRLFSGATRDRRFLIILFEMVS